MAQGTIALLVETATGKVYPREAPGSVADYQTVELSEANPIWAFYDDVESAQTRKDWLTKAGRDTSGLEVMECAFNVEGKPIPAEPRPEPEPEPTFWLRRVTGSGGETVVAEGPDADAAVTVVFRMGDYVQTEGIPPYALFGDKPPGNLTYGTITAPVTAEALDADGEVIAIATL